MECCGFNPTLIKVVTDVSAKIAIVRNKIVIEPLNEQVGHFTINNRSIYRSRLCYLNIINPIYYLYQYKLKNDDIYFYDDNFIWVDIDIKDAFNSDLKIKLTKTTKQIKGLTINEYRITTTVCEKIHIRYHKMPSNQVYRYKLTNIASQLFYSIFILCLAILQLVKKQENSHVYLCALIILFVISAIKIYKYHSSKSTRDI